MPSKHIRGAKLISAGKMRHKLNPWWWLFSYNGLKIGDVWLPRNRESQHALILGDQGSGKTTLLEQILAQIESRGEPAVIVDPECELITKFYRPERGDHILNPRDARGSYWSPWAEIRPGHEKEDLATLVASMIRDTARTKSEQYYQDKGRELLRRAFTRTATVPNLLAEVERDKGPGREDAYTAVQPLLILPARKDCEREWSVASYDRKGWLFLTSTDDSREITRELQGTLLDLLINRLLCSELYGKKIWVVGDEVQKLGRQQNMIEGLTRGRKREMAFILSLQTVAQLRTIYGVEPTKTIAGQPKTKIFFACEEPETARWESDIIGREDIQEGKIIHRDVPVVSFSDIQTLPPLTAYCVAGGLRAQIKVSRARPAARVEGFIFRKTAVVDEPYQKPVDLTDAQKAYRFRTIQQRIKLSPAYKDVELRFKDWKALFAELGPPPDMEQDWEIGRINEPGHYEVGNIQWETKDENLKKKRARGVKQQLEKDLAEQNGELFNGKSI